MATDANSFAKLLMQTFQELAQNATGNKSNDAQSKTPENADHKKFDDRANQNHSKRNTKQYKQKQNVTKKKIQTKPQRNNRRKQNNDNYHIQNEKKNENKSEENISNLQDFVVSVLKFAPNQTMITSELGLKITDVFDKSVKQITGLKSQSFFDRMSEKRIIKIETKQTNHGSLSFAQLIKKKANRNHVKHENGMKQNIHKETRKEIQVHTTRPQMHHRMKSQDEEIEVDEQSNHSEASQHEQEIKTETQNEDKVQIECDDAIEIVRNAILRNFLDGSRERIMLSSISAYCYKYTGVHWKKIMIQKPKEFVNDLVHDGLVILDTEFKNNSSYPYIVLNKNNPKVKQLNLYDLNTKKRKRETLESDGPSTKRQRENYM